MDMTSNVSRLTGEQKPAYRLLFALATAVSYSRIKAYAAIMLGVVTIEYIFSYTTGSGFLDRFGQVKGTDFVEFYTAAKLIAQGRGSALYVFQPPFQFPIQFAAEAHLLAPQVQHPDFAFVVPPFFALLFIPLATLPYLWAYGTWVIANILLLAVTLRLLRPHILLLQGPHRRLAWLVAASFFPFLECLADGQNAVVSLFLFALAYIALRRGQDELAGIVLGCTLFKPQLVVTLAVLLLVTRRWRAVMGLAITAILLVGVSWAIVGTQGVLDYAALSATMPGWIYLPGWRTWNMHSWNSFFVLLVSNSLVSRVLTAAASLGTLALLLRSWRMADPSNHFCFDMQYALAILGTVLVSPHVFAYDLILLVLPGLLLTNAIVTGKLPRRSASTAGLKLILALNYFAPLVSRFTAMDVHLQLSVPIIAALLIITTVAFQQVPLASPERGTVVPLSQVPN